MAEATKEEIIDLLVARLYEVRWFLSRAKHDLQEMESLLWQTTPEAREQLIRAWLNASQAVRIADERYARGPRFSFEPMVPGGVSEDPVVELRPEHQLPRGGDQVTKRQ